MRPAAGCLAAPGPAAARMHKEQAHHASPSPPMRHRPLRAQDMLSRELMADAEDGTLRLLYTTPESLATERLRRAAPLGAQAANSCGACGWTAQRAGLCQRFTATHSRPLLARLRACLQGPSEGRARERPAVQLCD